MHSDGDEGWERLPVFLNGTAGLDRDRLQERITEALGAAGVEGEVIEMPPQRIAASLRERVREGWRRLGVAGGDGTMLTAADELAGTGVALAPIPTGTLNHFARRLGIADLAGAARALRDGAELEVPLGIVDERVFLNTATLGFYADVVRRRERYRRWLMKWPAAVVAFARTLPRLRPMRLTLVVDGAFLERETTLVWIGVGSGSFPLVHEAPAPRRAPELEIVILRPRSALRTVALAARLTARYRRRELPVRDPGVEVLHARQLLVHGERRIGVTLDGEVLRCHPPIFVAVQDDALRVVVPRRTAHGQER